MIGDANVGKTSIAQRFVKGVFLQHSPTVASDFVSKYVEIAEQGEPKMVRL